MKPNRILKSIITLFLGFGLMSCESFLDLPPETNYGTTGNFYKNQTDIEYALTSVYASLQANAYYRNHMVLLTDVRSDDLGSFANTGGNAGREYHIKNFTAQSDNQIFRDAWRNMYETIFRANKILNNINVVTNEKLKLEYEAQARFIRALTYFNIVRFWGDAPLLLTAITPKEAEKSIRNKASEIYKAIEEDLMFASDVKNLPKRYSGSNTGRVGSLAAKGLLGKVYLQQKKYSEAATTLSELINNDNEGTHSLMTDIANVFSTAPAPGSSNQVFKDYTGWNPQLMNKEILFEILFSKDIPSEGRNALTYYANQADINEDLKITSKTCIYDPTDRRADLMKSIRGTNTDNQLLVKYADIRNTLGDYAYPIVILRWADVLLMYAEALNELGFDNSKGSIALNTLNKVRTRSFSKGSYSASDLPDQAAFRKAIFLERRLEFPMEMQRWFDLIRSGEAIDAMKEIGNTITEKDFLYPIPNSEIELRNDPINFPQNKGY